MSWPIPEPTMWYAAPDYVTLTTRKSDNVASIREHYEYVGRTVADWLGEDPRSDEQAGQNGYTGRRIGPVFWGAGYNGACLQISGAGAEKAASLRPYWDNVSRLDVQVTLWYAEDYETLGLKCARKSHSAATGARHRPWGVEHIHGFGKGDTCYIGSRKSARFCRIYDKWRESDRQESWRYSWRFEVELKEGEGAAHWPYHSGTVPDTNYWASVAVSEFERRGLTLPTLLPRALAEEERVPKGETTNARRLRWLATQVAPSIGKLLRAGIPALEIAQALAGSTEASDRLIAETYDVLTERYQ